MKTLYILSHTLTRWMEGQSLPSLQNLGRLGGSGNGSAFTTWAFSLSAVEGRLGGSGNGSAFTYLGLQSLSGGVQEGIMIIIHGSNLTRSKRNKESSVVAYSLTRLRHPVRVLVGSKCVSQS